jgi:hypothetical protein
MTFNALLVFLFEKKGIGHKNILKRYAIAHLT